MKICYNLHGDNMPAMYTHIIFAENVYNKLELKIRNSFKSKKQIYKIFSQSFDFFYNYNLLNYKKGKDIRKFASYCHRHNTQEYILNIIKYIKNNNLYHNQYLLSYLYGSITHYILDSTMHPYINYLVYANNNKTKYHTKIEGDIDKYYFMINNNVPLHTKDITKIFLKKYKLPKHLKKCLDIIYLNTFNKKNIGNIYESCYNQNICIYRLIRKDKFGIKKMIYKILDKFLIIFNFKLEYYSHYSKSINKSFLNLENKEWFNPKNKEIIFNYSWNELFEQAERKCITIINLCHKYFKNQLSLKKLKYEIPNISYTNGLPIKN